MAPTSDVRITRQNGLSDYEGEFEGEVVRGEKKCESPLYLHVGILTEPKQVNHKLYSVDLNAEELISVATVELPPTSNLEGVLQNGTLIFSVQSPVPGILAYRIVPN